MQNVICVKWMDYQAVTPIGRNVGDLNQMSLVLGRQKVASRKSSMPCLIIVKKYNESMGGVSLCHKYTATYHLDRSFKFRFYLRIFFYLMNVAMVNSLIIYDKLHLNTLSFLDFKLVVSKNFFGSLSARTREFPSTHLTMQQITQVVTNEVQPYFLKYQQTRRRCVYCTIGGIENRTLVTCVICDIPLYLQKEKHTNK